MSASASGTTVAVSSSQAESSTAVRENVEADATVPAPRRGARTRKPTSKAAGLDPTEASSVSAASQQTAPRTGKKRKADDLNAEQTHVSFEHQLDADRIDEEIDGVFHDAEDGDDDEDDQKQYCICRGKDDGTFMISCERCQEWYHTKCIGITQKAAKKLNEYICDSCSQKDVETRTPGSKVARRYKSSKGKRGRQTPSAPDTQEDEASPEREEEEEEEHDQDDASDGDGDEYIGERGDFASEAEDAMVKDAPVPVAFSRSQRNRRSDAGTSHKAEAISKANVEPSSTGDADKNARRRASDSLRRSSASSKHNSISKKGASRRHAGPTDASTEEARSRARNVLATALEKIFVGSDSQQIHAKGDTMEEPNELEESDQQRAESFAALLEQELFESNADAHGSIRVVGTRYKDRFRTFLFSLKDAKNTTLHSRIASGGLKPSELAKMSNEELANDSIRQATEKARLEALHRSTLRPEEGGPMRKITHKGEIEIESEVLDARDQPGKFQNALSTRMDTAARVSESEPAVSTSSDHGTGIPADAGSLSPQDDMTRRSAPAPSLAQGSPTRLNLGDVWIRNTHTKSQDDENEPQESFGFDMGSSDDDHNDHTTGAEPDNATTSGADDFIDSFLDGPAEVAAEPTGSADQAPSNQRMERSMTPEAEPPSNAIHRFRKVIWNGLIDLPDVFAFQGHVKQVAGRSLAPASRVWPKFFPERPLLIAGRLPSKAAVDYLLQVVNAPRTEILAFTMEPGASKDGAARPQDSDQASFDGMLKHFKNADRWGALHIPSSVRGSLIKDFYAVPLYNDEEVPLWLDMAESDCLGAEWHTKRDRDLLVLVAVVIRDSLQAELSKAERSEGRQRSTTNDDGRQQQGQHIQSAPGLAPDEGYDPLAGLSLPLGTSVPTMQGAAASGAPAAPAAFGNDALQSLLRTLGNATATPSSSSITAAASGAMSPLGALPAGPPPPGPPPGPPPSFAGFTPPTSASQMAGSWPPTHPAAGKAYAAQPYGYAGTTDPAAYESHGGWGQEAGWNDTNGPPSSTSPVQPQEMPEEEYPGQYNPDYLAQASSGTMRGGPGFGGSGRGNGHGYGPGSARGWTRGRGW